MLLLRRCLLSLCVLPSAEGGLLVKSNAVGFAWGALTISPGRTLQAPPGVVTAYALREIFLLLCHMPSFLLRHPSYSIPALLEDLIQGKYSLPDFQRDFVWSEKQVVDLLDSIYRGIFIGVPTVVEHAGMIPSLNLESVADLHNYLGFDCSSRLRSSVLVIDGQQRLTSILYIFYCETLALLPTPMGGRPSIQKAMNLLENAVGCVPRSSGSPTHGKSKGFVILVRHDRGEEPFEGSKIIRDEYVTTQELYDIYLEALSMGHSFPSPSFIADWLNSHKPSIHLGVAAAADALFQIIYKIFSDYQVVISELRPGSSMAAFSSGSLLNTLAITFDRINSKGIRIGLFDIAVAAFYKYRNIRHLFDSLKSRLRGMGGSLPYLGSGKGIRGEDILRTMALILRVTVKKGEILGDIDDKVQLVTKGGTVATIGGITISAASAAAAFLDVWKYAEESYIRALERLRERYGVYSFDPSKQKSSMPYSSMLPVLAAFLHVAHHHPNAAAHRDCVEAMIDFWYWISVFDKRYSSTPDTTSETDVNQFHDWVNSLGTGSVRLPNFFKNYCGKHVSIDLAKTKQGQAIFRGILNIIYKEGALDWLDNGGKIPQLKGLSPKHLNQDHIFPKSPPKGTTYPGSIMGIPIDTIKNSILNVTLISEGANKKKKSKAPSSILTDLTHLCSTYPPRPSPSDLLAGHLINPDAEKAMAADDIEAFLEHRQKAIIDRIQKLMNGILNRLAKHCPGMSSGCEITFKAEVPQQKSPQDQD
jgi:hypothetical protein